MNHVQHGSLKVKGKHVMKGHVGKHDEILEKREERVHARLAKGVVTPIAVHGRGQREQVPARDEQLPANAASLRRIFAFVHRKPTDEQVQKLMQDGAEHEEGKAQFMNEEPVRTGNVGEQDKRHVFHHEHEERQSADERIGHVVQRVVRLSEIVLEINVSVEDAGRELGGDGDAPNVFLRGVAADGRADGREIVGDVAMRRRGLRPIVLDGDDDATEERRDRGHGQESEGGHEGRRRHGF